MNLGLLKNLFREERSESGVMFSRSILAGIALAMAATDVMGFAPTASLYPVLARSGRATAMPALVGRKSLVSPQPKSPAEPSGIPS